MVLDVQIIIFGAEVILAVHTNCFGIVADDGASAINVVVVVVVLDDNVYGGDEPLWLLLLLLQGPCDVWLFVLLLFFVFVSKLAYFLSPLPRNYIIKTFHSYGRSFNAAIWTCKKAWTCKLLQVVR